MRFRGERAGPGHEAPPGVPPRPLACDSALERHVLRGPNLLPLRRDGVTRGIKAPHGGQGACGSLLLFLPPLLQRMRLREQAGASILPPPRLQALPSAHQAAGEGLEQPRAQAAAHRGGLGQRRRRAKALASHPQRQVVRALKRVLQIAGPHAKHGCELQVRGLPVSGVPPRHRARGPARCQSVPPHPAPRAQPQRVHPARAGGAGEPYHLLPLRHGQRHQRARLRAPVPRRCAAAQWPGGGHETRLGQGVPSTTADRL